MSEKTSKSCVLLYQKQCSDAVETVFHPIPRPCLVPWYSWSWQLPYNHWEWHFPMTARWHLLCWPRWSSLFAWTVHMCYGNYSLIILWPQVTCACLPWTLPTVTPHGNSIWTPWRLWLMDHFLLTLSDSLTAVCIASGNILSTNIYKYWKSQSLTL